MDKLHIRKRTELTQKKMTKTLAANPHRNKGLIIVAVIDERTPEICRLMDGLPVVSETLISMMPPHDTEDPENLCRCVVV